MVLLPLSQLIHMQLCLFWSDAVMVGKLIIEIMSPKQSIVFPHSAKSTLCQIFYM